MKYKVGDKVRVIKNLTGHRYEIGIIITIAEVNETNYFIEEEVDGCTWTVTDSDIEAVLEIKQSTPKRYATDSIEVIDFCKLYNLNFNLGNVVKYTCRDKGTDIEDYKKAIDYLQREINHLKSLE